MASAVFGLASHGVVTVGSLPQGVPRPALPWTNAGDVPPLLLAALGITLVSLTDTIATATSFAARRGEEVKPDQEMVGLGAANLAAGFFGGFAVSTSGSRTAVAEQSGAKTQMAGLVGAGLVAVLLLFLNSLLADLPQTALAAVVIAAAISLMDVRLLRRYRRVRPSALWVSFVASAGVILLGVLQGIVIAVLLAIVLFFRRNWWPHGAVLGRSVDSEGWHDLALHPDAQEVPGVVVYRWEAPLFFANSGRFRRDRRRDARAARSWRRSTATTSTSRSRRRSRRSVRRRDGNGLASTRRATRGEEMAEELTRKRRKRLEDFISPFRVDPDRKVVLPGDFDPAFKGGLRKKKEGRELLAEGIELLSTYQARLAAEGSRGVLVVLQAIDAAGKDGTIRHVMSGVNPQGVSVHSFKVPSGEEIGHDYLWRYARRLPSRGEIGIFNRSHYEEVLAVRLHPKYLERQGLPADARKGGIWRRRFREINEWERYLTENGIHIVKLFLNLSKEEQRARLLRRIDLPDHNWKFSEADIAERGLWDSYQEAISDVLTHTSTEWAPWHVIPADRKWFGRIATAAVLVDTLIEMDPRYPKVDHEQRRALQDVKRELEAEAPRGAPRDPNRGSR